MYLRSLSFFACLAALTFLCGCIHDAPEKESDRRGTASALVNDNDFFADGEYCILTRVHDTLTLVMTDLIHTPSQRITLRAQGITGPINLIGGMPHAVKGTVSRLLTNGQPGATFATTPAALGLRLNFSQFDTVAHLATGTFSFAADSVRNTGARGSVLVESGVFTAIPIR